MACPTEIALDDLPVDVRYEPCAQHAGATDDEPCARCGWLAVEHTAGLAVVIEVAPITTAHALRRAS
jgi:hypothetical protein